MTPMTGSSCVGVGHGVPECGCAGRPSELPRAPTRVTLVVLAAAVVAPAPSLAASSVLRLGDHGTEVGSLQRRLVDLGYFAAGGVDGVFGNRTWDAVLAFQGWERLDRDGVVGAATRHALTRARRPQPWLRVPRALEVDLDRQVLLVVRDGTALRAIHASTGANPHATPRGRFEVVRRERISWSRPYRVWLPYAVYFHRGWAIHGFATVPRLPATHGCIRIPLNDAGFVFEFARVGTRIAIRAQPHTGPGGAGYAVT
jgi:L,D-transpeptidase catalytic domain/Putative peptidoglycan binding domain